MMAKVYCLIALSFIGLSLQTSTPSSSTYEAGVVEFAYERNPSLNSSQTLDSNRLEYIRIMSEAPSTLDIIVFPEMTLNGMETAVETPEPNDKLSPCESNDFPADNLVKQISCSAKTHQRYVVVNIVTKASCPDADMVANEDPRNCTDRDDGMSYYNTNVVFDRNGTLISRYRKYNLFGESVDKPHKPSMISFETDFGVKFGHFVCFDLMFRFPALELVRNQNITEIVFTTMWFSELPFLTAAQVQQNWAYANNVNLLAAGANNPEVGSTGTGIYAATKGSLTSVMEGLSKTTLLTALVPKRGLGDSILIVQNSVRNPRTEMAPLKLKRDQLDNYSFRIIGLQASAPGTSITSNLCHGELCCSFTYSVNVEATTTQAYVYGMAVYHGNRTFDGFADGGVVACAILACQTAEIATCGVRNESLAFAHTFDKIEITGTFPGGDQFFYLPTTLDQSIMPLDVNAFSYQKIESNIDDSTNYTITIKAERNLRDFYTFGIYGRDFLGDFNLDVTEDEGDANLDVTEDEGDAAGIVQMSCILIAVLSTIATINNLS